MKQKEETLGTIRERFPDVQAVYLFGSHGTEAEWPDSDIDLAILLPPRRAKTTTAVELNACRALLSEQTRKDVDLVNIRRVSTVFQKEITTTGRILYCADQYAVDEFEMLVISYYQKLNEERREILEEFAKTGRAYPV